MNTETIAEAIINSGFYEYGEIALDKLVFHEEIRQICEDNSCRGYGKTWACPPAVGTLEECKARCLSYQHFILFSGRYELEDSFDFEGMKNALCLFKGAADRLDEALAGKLAHYRILSNEGCIRCAKCSYPDSACRFPKQLFHSIEGYGFLVSELADLAGITYNNGPGTLTYFGALLY